MERFNKVQAKTLSMKICKVCLSSDILCAGCSRRLEDGKITKTDIDISRAIHKISREKDFNVDFLQGEEDNGKVFVIVESRHAAKFIGPGGRNIKKLSEMLRKPVKMLEKSEGSEKHMIEKLIGAPVLGINKVYASQKAHKENGSRESFKVRVEKRYARTTQPLAGVVGKILGRKISFVFE